MDSINKVFTYLLYAETLHRVWIQTSVLSICSRSSWIRDSWNTKMRDSDQRALQDHKDTQACCNLDGGMQHLVFNLSLWKQFLGGIQVLELWDGV